MLRQLSHLNARKYEIKEALSLFENRIQRHFEGLNFDDYTRFPVFLIDRVDIAIEALLTGVQFGEFVGMGFGPFSLYLHHGTSHLYPTASILRINHQQRYLWVGTHVATLLPFKGRVDENTGAIVVCPDQAGLGLSVRHDGR